jgi:hypothetical protein
MLLWADQASCKQLSGKNMSLQWPLTFVKTLIYDFASFCTSYPPFLPCSSYNGIALNE